jgi:hypothetical protein
LPEKIAGATRKPAANPWWPAIPDPIARVRDIGSNLAFKQSRTPFVKTICARAKGKAMSISSPSSSTLTDYASIANSVSSGQGGKRVGEHHHHGGADEFMQAIQNALSQAGVTGTQAAAGTSTQTASTGSDADGDNDGHRSRAIAGQQGIGHDVHKLVHDLFAAIQQAESQAAAGTGSSAGTSVSSAANATSASSDLSSFDLALQSLIQQVGGSGSTSPAKTTPDLTSTASGTSSGGAISSLQRDFLNLVNATSQSKDSNTSNSSSSQPSLQSFLQDLLSNLKQGAVKTAVTSLGV